jgi:hypothetical protein
VLVGLARVRYPRVPWMAAGSIFVLFLLFVAATGTWAATCWSCSGPTDRTRSELFFATLIYQSIIVGTTLIGIWLGSRMTVVLQRLLRSIGEMRSR